ncbi:hypothetical protein ACFE04_005627 [Oxalis oulophora]
MSFSEPLFLYTITRNFKLLQICSSSTSRIMIFNWYLFYRPSLGAIESRLGDILQADFSLMWPQHGYGFLLLTSLTMDVSLDDGGCVFMSCDSLIWPHGCCATSVLQGFSIFPIEKIYMWTSDDLCGFGIMEIVDPLLSDGASVGALFRVHGILSQPFNQAKG